MAIRAGWHQLSNKLTSSHDTLTKVNPLLHLLTTPTTPSIKGDLYIARYWTFCRTMIDFDRFRGEDFLEVDCDDRRDDYWNPRSKLQIYVCRQDMWRISWKIVEDKILKLEVYWKAWNIIVMVDTGIQGLRRSLKLHSRQPRSSEGNEKDMKIVSFIDHGIAY